MVIDPFSFNIVKERESNTTTVNHVEKGNCIFLTNKVEHGGRKNEHQLNGKPADAICLFAYMVSDEKDFPSDTVQYFTDNSEQGSKKD